MSRILKDYATMATVERMHAENKVFFEKLGDRIRSLELKAEHFSGIEATLEKMGLDISRIKDTIQPKAVRWFVYPGILLPIIITVGAWIWQAAQYPTRPELLLLSNRIGQIEINLIKQENELVLRLTELRKGLLP